MTKRSRVPEMPDAPPPLVQFLDAMDRRQLSVSQLTDLDTGASSAEIVAKVNAILEAHRTK
jgi:hypothetical protein